MDINPTNVTGPTPALNTQQAGPSKRPPQPEAAQAPAATPSTIVTLSSDATAPQNDAKGADDPTASNEQPSKLKSFGYGVAGLGTPKTDAQIQAETPEQRDTEDSYTAGRVAATALTVGAALSLLV
jgi:hypothetical protein